LRLKLRCENYINLLGQEIDVSLGRILFTSFFAASLAAGSYLYINQQKKRRSAQGRVDWKLEKINKRYKSRIVKAEDMKVAGEKTLQVEVKTFQELLRLAEEMERPVVQLTSEQGGEEKTVVFYVFEEETLYYYVLS